MVLFIEVFYLWYQILQLCRKRNENLLAAPRPCTSIQDLNVDRVSCTGIHKNNWVTDLDNK